MINELQAYKFCKDDISKIENYDKAIADTAHTWDLHHILELTLDGDFAHSREELMHLGMYYNRPYFELIFLTRSEHSRLHGQGRKGKNNSFYGKHHADETRRKISDAQKGKKRQPFTEEHRRKLSESAKARWARHASNIHFNSSSEE